MMVFNLLRAEWHKTLRNPANWGLLGATVCILGGGLALVTLAGFKGPEQLARAQDVLPFPNNLRMTLQVLSAISGMLAVIFVANSVGGEYARDTWKMIIPRNHRRPALIGVKLLSGLAGIFILLAASVLVGGLVGMLGAAVLKIGPLGAFKPEILKAQAGALSGMGVEMLCYGMLALMATVAARSTIGGAMVGVLAIPISTVAVFSSQLAANVLPALHLNNIIGHWSGNNRTLAMCQAAFGGEVPPTTSLAIIAAYTIVFAVCGFVLFQRRDLAG
ncbi:MAG: ABC transporter permease [Blastocatellia bacterium]|nr:ABC transporter permease [Blastocatellia bacterium]